MTQYHVQIYAVSLEYRAEPNRKSDEKELIWNCWQAELVMRCLLIKSI